MDNLKHSKNVKISNPVQKAYAQFLQKQITFFQAQLAELENESISEEQTDFYFGSDNQMIQDNLAFKQVPPIIQVSEHQDDKEQDSQLSRILDYSLLQRCDDVLRDLDAYRQELQSESQDENQPSQSNKGIYDAISGNYQPNPVNMEKTTAMYSEYSMASRDYLRKYGLAGTLTQKVAQQHSSKIESSKTERRLLTQLDKFLTR